MARKAGCLEPVVVIFLIVGWIVIGLAGVVGTGIFWLVPHVIPQAKLQRDSNGLFLVNEDNYDDWKTYSAVFSNINGKVGYGRLEGDFRIRVLPRLTDDAPSRIANAGNYRSSFHSVTSDEADVVLITREDDEIVNTYRSDLLNAVKAHNDAVVAAGFDAKLRFEKPELDINPIVEFGFLHDEEPWMRNCVAGGCPVNVKVEYSSTFFDGPNVPIVGSGFIVTSR